MKVYCADEECISRSQSKRIEISDKLILIGNSYKCMYCRGYKFILTPDK